MPQVEETFASYLSPDSASSLKRLTLPTKLSSTTSTLMGKAFQAASQAGAELHTMAVLQAYKADLSAGSTIDEEAFTELRWATNFSHHATMQPSNFFLATLRGEGLLAIQPCPSPSIREAQKQSVKKSVVSHTPPREDWRPECRPQ